MSIELYNVDCMEYMRDQPSKSFDLAVVDPPYGIGEDGQKNKRRNRFAVIENHKHLEAGDTVPSAEYFKELRRVSKNQVIWGANHFIDKMPFPSSCWLVWDKENGDSDFADCELAWTSHKSAVRRFRYQWAGMLQADMKNKERRIHPTQKPMRLYQWILTNYAKPGQRILDTHLGSGSSAIAAHYFGVDFVGCEIDEHYFNLAKQRIEQETRQIALF